MQDNILFFLAYCFLAVILINIINNSKVNRIVLFVLSIGFYLISDYKYLILLVGSTLWGYFLAPLCKSKKKWFLWLSLVPLIIVLFIIKWSEILISRNILLPLGLSYYFFKIISYEIDLYRGDCEAEESFIDLCNYVFFFPQIVCGPIARISDLRGQLTNLKRINEEQFEGGFYLVVFGLFKKVVLADRISPYVNSVFADSNNYPGMALWIAAFLFTIEIYCDFSGYSDIVIGICRLMGIKCKPNFKLPYFSYSVSDFWRRWHISLSEWLRDYIYIPLGGSRQGKIKKFVNVIVTFLVSGAWHGAGATYLLWGIWHGAFNCIPVKKSDNKLIFFLQRILTFILVAFGWILFKSSSVKDAFNYVIRMFADLDLRYESIVASVLPFTGDYSCVAVVLLILILLLILLVMESRDFKMENVNGGFTIGRMVILLCLVVLFGSWGSNSFIYAGY